MTGSSHSLGGLKLPGYLHHQSSGHVRVMINGAEHYLGPHGSEESRKKYGELIAKYIAGLPIDPLADAAADGGITSPNLSWLFSTTPSVTITRTAQSPTNTDASSLRKKPLIDLYGMTLDNDFGLLALRAVCHKMVDSKKKCRRFPHSRDIGRHRSNTN